MNKIYSIALAIALLWSVPALSCECGQGTHQSADGRYCLADSRGTSSRSANSQSDQHQHQSQTQSSQSTANAAPSTSNATGGSLTNSGNSSATTSATASNQGNSQSAASGNSTSYSSNYQEVRQAVDGYSTGTNSTAMCVRDQHAGIGTVIGGLSFGHGKRDSDCARQQLADEMWARGNDHAAEAIFCSISEVHKVLGDDCMAYVHTLHSAPAVATVAPDAVTHAELRTVEDRITSHMGAK